MIGDHRMEEVPTTVLSGERCHLGEGPTYDAATDTAWWFDIVERRLFEARLDNGRVGLHSLAVMGRARGTCHAPRHLPPRHGRLVRPRAGGWTDGAVLSARSRQCCNAFERCPG